MKAYEFDFPEDRFYLKNHVWLKRENGEIAVGITELGQTFSKGIVHIDLPDVGEFIKKGDLLIAYETIKAVSQISVPFDASVTSVNQKLWDEPDVINNDPYKEWIVKIKGELSVNNLMSAEQAAKFYTDIIDKERERYANN